MNNNQYTYNQPPMGQGMMPPQMPLRQRMVIGVGRMKDLFPKWLTQYSIGVYLLALIVVSFMYSEHSLPWYYMLSGVVAVMAFFLYGDYAARNLSLEKVRKEKKFEKKIFVVAFIPRLIFMLLIYWIFQANYGDAFGFEAGDAVFYHDIGEDFALNFKNGTFGEFWKEISESIDIFL